MRPNPTLSFPWTLRTLMHIGLIAAAAASTTARAEEVGRVSLLIGQARVVQADGTVRALSQGAAISVGDRIETGGNGHVHVRFVDNGAVSVRPDSALEVHAYRFDRSRPQANEVRLRVGSGVARSISGEATELDKSRFRLNTPIAAIGIRGTDFIVRADLDAVRASVSDGAIVIGPLGAGCTASALGPCTGAQVLELTAEMGQFIAEVFPGETARLVAVADPAAALLAHAAYGGPSPRLIQAARRTGLLAAQPTVAEVLRGNDAAAAGLLTVAAVNVPKLNRPSSTSAELIWGRWAILPDANDRLSVPFALARLGRLVTVADEEMGLFRREQTVGGTPLAGAPQGLVDFWLTRAAATYESPVLTEPASITGARLTIDFGRRTFATALDMNSPAGGRTELRVAGELRSDGLFAVRDEAQRVAGAVALNGKEAGYLFERNVGTGLFKGRTLWGD